VPSQRGGRARRSDGFVDCAADRFSFADSGNSAENCTSVEQGRKCDGERACRDLVQCGKAFVIDLLLAALQVELDDLHGQGIVEVSGRIVEGEMSVGSDAAAYDVDGCGAKLPRIVVGRFCGIIAGLDQVDRCEVEMIEDRAAQPEPEALRRIVTQTDVLVHVKRGNAQPVDAAFFAEPGEHFTLAGCGGEDHSHAGLVVQAYANFLCDVGSGARAHCSSRLRDMDGDCVERGILQDEHDRYAVAFETS